MKSWTTLGDGNDPCQCGALACDQCPAAALCLLNRLQRRQADAARDSITPLPPVAAGQMLSLTAEPADAVYVIRRGALKWLATDFNGKGCVSGFLLQGALIAPLSDLCCGWEDRLVALQETWLCRVRLSQCPIRVRQQFLRLRSASLRDEWAFHCRLVAASAVQRLTAFLLRLSTLMDSATFRLPMADSDIAEYLHLEPQALGCAKHQLIRCGWLQTADRQVRILDSRALRKLLSD